GAEPDDSGAMAAGVPGRCPRLLPRHRRVAARDVPPIDPSRAGSSHAVHRAACPIQLPLAGPFESAARASFGGCVPRLTQAERRRLGIGARARPFETPWRLARLEWTDAERSNRNGRQARRGARPFTRSGGLSGRMAPTLL